MLNKSLKQICCKLWSGRSTCFSLSAPAIFAQYKILNIYDCPYLTFTRKLPFSNDDLLYSKGRPSGLVITAPL